MPLPCLLYSLASDPLNPRLTAPLSQSGSRLTNSFLHDLLVSTVARVCPAQQPLPLRHLLRRSFRGVNHDRLSRDTGGCFPNLMQNEQAGSHRWWSCRNREEQKRIIKEREMRIRGGAAHRVSIRGRCWVHVYERHGNFRCSYNPAHVAASRWSYIM